QRRQAGRQRRGRRDGGAEDRGGDPRDRRPRQDLPRRDRGGRGGVRRVRRLGGDHRRVIPASAPVDDIPGRGGLRTEASPSCCAGAPCRSSADRATVSNGSPAHRRRRGTIERCLSTSPTTILPPTCCSTPPPACAAASCPGACGC